MQISEAVGTAKAKAQNELDMSEEQKRNPLQLELGAKGETGRKEAGKVGRGCM